MTQDRLPLGGVYAVIDSEPRTLDAEQIDSLRSLAELVSNQLNYDGENRQLLAAERKQKEIGDRLNKIALRVPGMLYEFRRRPDGMVSFPYVSEGLRSITNIAPEQVRENAQRRSSPFIPKIAENAASIDDSHERYRNGGVSIVSATPTVRCWMLGNSVPEREADGGTLWHGYLADITKTKQAEI